MPYIGLATSSEDPPSAHNRTTRAISELLSAIFRAEFKVGDHLTETALAEKLGMSRTPVREALVELKGLGLVEVRRNRGALVKGFSALKLSEIYEVRRLLEVEATRKATHHMDPQILLDLLTETRQLHETQGNDENWRLDQRIHAAIATACQNQTLAHEIDRYSTLVQAIRITVGARIHVQQLTTEQHLEILEAMTKGEDDAAAVAMHRHLEQAEKSAVAALADWLA